MQASIMVHALAGVTGILTGFVALYAAKGGKIHRRGGILFVVAMVTMAATGAVIALFKAEEASVLGGTLTMYLVFTAFTTVRPVTIISRRIEWSALIAALAIGLANLSLAVDSIVHGQFLRKGIPIPTSAARGACVTPGHPHACMPAT